MKLDPSPSPSPPGSNSKTGQAHVPAGRDDQDMEAVANQEAIKFEDEEDQDEEHCVICLQEIQDRTILPCAHDRLCFNCILLWCEQSRKCPLCNAPIGDHLIHNFRSKYDYSKHYLPPLASSPPPANVLARFHGIRAVCRDLCCHCGDLLIFILVLQSRNRDGGDRWGRRRRQSTSQEREDALERAISRRRWIYHHDLYAKVGLEVTAPLSLS